MKYLIIFAKKLEILSAISCRLTKLTGKSKVVIHPKHLVKQALPEYFNLFNKKQMVLDLGCHRGERSIKIAPKVRQVIAADVDERLLKVAQSEVKRRKIKNITFQMINAEQRLSFKDNSFDIILFLDVLEHLRHRDQAMNELHRILKKNGRLVLSVPNKNTSWKKLQKSHGLFYYSDPDHKTEFSELELKKIMQKHQFKINKFVYVSYDIWLAPIIDLVGGVSLDLYKKLSEWKTGQQLKYPENSIGFRLIAGKKL